MAVADILKDIGSGLATGAKAVGAVAAPVLSRTAQVVSGEAPQIDAEKRQQTEKLEDEQINAKAQALESQLAMGQKYGTLTPQQQQQYVDQITGLYSHPRHAGTLMEKLRKTIHPNGAYAQGPTAPLANATPQGGTGAADEKAKENAVLADENIKDDAARQQAIKTADFLVTQLPPNTPPDQVAAFRNNTLDHLLGAATGREPEPKGFKAIEQDGNAVGVTDQDTGKQYLPSQLGPGGDAPPQAKSMWSAIQKAQKDKQDAADKKAKEVADAADKRENREDERQQRSENFQSSMLGQREQEQAFSKLDQEANNSQALVDTYKQQYAQPGNHSATDTALIADYTSVLAKGGRKTQAELQMARNIGSFQLNMEQKIRKVTTGELPPELRQMYLDYMAAAAQTQRQDASNIKPSPGGSTGAKKVGSLLPKTGAKPAGNVIVVTPEDMK